ncbi:MAG: GerMN domain-containing protein, partial [Acetivibrio ethanolgignens]
MRKRSIICILAILILAMTGCGKKQTGKDRITEDTNYLYYLNNAENQLVAEEYKVKTDDKDTQGQIGEYLEALMKVAPQNRSYKKAVPESVIITQVGAVENEQLTLSFNSEYKKLSVTQEILCRAAIVKTLCQVENVTYVSFLVDGQPLKDSLDKPIGFMTAEDFIDNTGGETKFEQNAIVTLYFSDKTGEQLVETRVKIRYDGAVPIEQLVIEQLVKGP